MDDEGDFRLAHHSPAGRRGGCFGGSGLSFTVAEIAINRGVEGVRELCFDFPVEIIFSKSKSETSEKGGLLIGNEGS